MSTQSVIHHIKQSKLAVVPFPAPQPVTQTELILVLGMRGRLHQLEEQVQSAEQSIKTRLETARGSRHSEAVFDAIKKERERLINGANK